MNTNREIWKRLREVTAEQVIPHLKKVKQSPRGHSACCPAHDDKNPSLSIWNGDDGYYAVQCWSGCSDRDVRAAINNLLPNGYRTDFTPKPAKKRPQSDEDRHKRAILKTKSIIQRSVPATTEDSYFKTKGVEIRGEIYHCPLTKEQMKSTLGYVPSFKGVDLETPYSIVPVTNGGKLAGSQLIGACKSKVFISGTNASGSSWVTEKLPEAPQRPIVVGEGIATVLSAIQATGHYGVACLTLGNFSKVLAQLRAKYPSATIGILAEIDKKTGRIHDAQMEAAEKYNAHLIVPTTIGSDVNDQHVTRGIDTVRHSINAQMIDVKQYRPKGAEWWKVFNDTGRLNGKISAASESPNPAQWCFAICSRFLYRMNTGAFIGDDLPSPREFIHSKFNLTEIERDELSAYFEWKLDERRFKAIKHYLLTRFNLKLERDANDHLDWVKGKKESSPAKAILAKAEQASGKTSVFAKSYIEGENGEPISGVRYISLREMLARSAAAELGIDYREDPVWATGSVATCYHSLLHPRFAEPEFKFPHTIILDEICQLAEDFCLTPLVDGAKKKELFDEIKRLCRDAKKVVALDADASDIGALFLAELCGIDPEDIFIIDTEPSKREFNLKLHYATSPHDNGIDLDAVIDHIKKGEKCCIAMESKEKAEVVRDVLEKAGFTIALVAADVPRSASIENLTYDELTPVHAVIYTSKIETGYSNLDDRFTKCFALFSGTILTAGRAIQMLRRFRAVSDFEVTIRVNHMVTDSNKPRFEAQGLTEWQLGFAQLKAFEHAYFATALTELLRQRRFIGGHRLTSVDKLDAKELREEYAPLILAANYTTELHRGENLTDQQVFENAAYRVRRAYDQVTPETVSRFQKDRPQAKRITNVRHDERWLIVRELIDSLSKDRLNKSDCAPLVERIRENRDRLKIMGALPERWAARGVPYKSDLGAVATFARHYGFIAKIAGDWLELSCTWREVEHVPTKDDKEAEVLRLWDTGSHSKKAIALQLDIPRTTVRRMIDNRVAKTGKNDITTNTCNDEIQQNGHPFEVIPNPTLEDLEDQLDTDSIGLWIANTASMPKLPETFLKDLNDDLNRRFSLFGMMLPKTPSLGRQLFGKEARGTPREDLARAMVGTDD